MWLMRPSLRPPPRWPTMTGRSFEQAWGGLKLLERPAPGNHEYYGYAKRGDNETGQNGSGYFAYFNGHDQDGKPNADGQAGDDTATNQAWYSYNLGNCHIISLNVACNSDAFSNDGSRTCQRLDM